MRILATYKGDDYEYRILETEDRCFGQTMCKVVDANGKVYGNRWGMGWFNCLALIKKLTNGKAFPEDNGTYGCKGVITVRDISEDMFPIESTLQPDTEQIF